jgi:MFS family permease
VHRDLTTRVGGELRTLPRQFWLLTGGTFVYLIGLDMCFPFQTTYLNRSLGVPMTTVGLILGVTLFAGLPMQIAGGAAADRFGRRPLLIVAIIASMTLLIGLALSRQLWFIVVLFAVEAAFGWAQYITASNSMVADLTPLERRAEAFSIMRVALNAGAMVGPLVAAILLALDPSFRLAFIGGGLVCGVFLLMVAVQFKETRPPTGARETVGTVVLGYGRVLRDRRLLAFCLVALLPLYGFGQVWVTLPIMLEDLQGVSAQMWGVIVAVHAAGTAVLQYPVVRVLGRYDHILLVALGSACVGTGLGGSAFAPWPWTFACIIILSFGLALFLPISSTIVSRMAPVALRGRYMGAWTLVYTAGYALGPLLGGWTLEALGGRGAFALVGAAGLLGAALFMLLRTRGWTGTGDGADATAALGEELRGERPGQVV